MAEYTTPFPVTVTTPAGAVGPRTVVALNLPATGGRMSVLAHHAPLVAALDAGETRLTLPGGATELWQSGDGVLTVDGAGEASLLLNRWDPSKETH
jgi:F0F1-type ATP synthase epsilon subunit